MMLLVSRITFKKSHCHRIDGLIDYNIVNNLIASRSNDKSKEYGMRMIFK